MNRALRPIVTLLVVSAASISAPPCMGQTYKKGDQIEVFFLKKWWPATVLNTNQRGEVLAEYQFAGRAHQTVFKQNEVHFAYESGALVPARNWSDPTGTFRIKAALLAVDDKEVTLRKSDMSELKVAIDKLSDADRQFLQKLQKQRETATIPNVTEPRGVDKVKAMLGAKAPASVAGPKLPPLETFAAGDGILATHSVSDSSGRPAIEVDPLPVFLKMKQGGLGFPVPRHLDRIKAVLPIGTSDMWLLVGIENGVPGHQAPSLALWVSLARQKIEHHQVLPPGEKLLDYHAASHRLLTTNMEGVVSGKGGQRTLTVWETKPTAKEIKPIVRWKVEAEHETFMFTPWARLIDGSLVIHRDKRQHYFVWDIAAKQARYEIQQESYAAPEPVLSGGRKYLFVPEDKGVRVLESTTGKWCTTLPTPGHPVGVAISEDGKRAAVLGRNSLAVWDLTTADAQPEMHQAEAIGTIHPVDMFWVNPERIVVGGWVDKTPVQRLFSLKSQVALWCYEFDADAVSDGLGARVREVCDGHLVYAARFDNENARVLAVGAVRLPGPQVDEVEAKLDAAGLFALKPGAAVNIVVNLGQDSERVRKALEAKAVANGWTVSDSAQVRLVAEILSGKSQTVQYRMMPIGRPPSTESATFTPQIPNLRVEVNGAIAWQTGNSSRGAPPFVTLRDSQTAQDEVDKWQRPRPEFFESAKIPARILDPKHQNGLGTTLVTTRGLVPKADASAAQAGP